LPPDGEPHGRVYHYVSPNSDLLGWIVERAGGAPFAAQFAQRIWQPLGAEREAYVTIDNHGASRTAGGICTTLRDLARLGEMVRQGGAANGNQIVPRAWIDDIWQNGDAAAWQRGSMVHLLPQGRYRSQWYITGGAEPALCAIGIHGQWIYVQPHSKLVIVKQSSQRDPVNDAVDHLNLAFFAAIAREFRSR
jgi:CubicO group peptidase (beta-lactamase class C family)